MLQPRNALTLIPRCLAPALIALPLLAASATSWAQPSAVPPAGSMAPDAADATTSPPPSSPPGDISSASPATSGSAAAPASAAASSAASPSASASAPAPTDGDDPARAFMARCSGCHTVGGGPLRGPDLSGVAGWERERLMAAIRNMQTQVGPLSASEVDSLASLLQDASVKRRLDDARARATALQAAKLEPPSAAIGRELFLGQRALLNGGVSCQACHRAGGDGGNLARDLTGVAARMEKAALQSGIESASYPVMRAAYARHPVTPQEAAHLVAFLASTGTGEARAPDLVAGLGVGLAFGALLAAFFYTSRRVTRPRTTRSRRSHPRY